MKMFQPFVFSEKDLFSKSISSTIISKNPNPSMTSIIIPNNSPKIEMVSMDEKPMKKTLIISDIKQKTLCPTNVQDGLFWAIYMAVYGETEYYRNKYNYGKIEIQEKQRLAEFMRTEGAKGLSAKSNYKLTRIRLLEIISDVTNASHMPISGLIAMAVYYQRDIFLVDISKKNALFFASNRGSINEHDENEEIEEGDKEKEKPIILYKNPLFPSQEISSEKINRTFSKRNEYFVDIDMSVQPISEIIENYFIIENYDKSLKGISTYKKNELDVIATKVGVDFTTLSKTELYHHLLCFLSPMSEKEENN